MRTPFFRMGLAAGILSAVPATALAAAEPWAPQSTLYQLGYRYSSIMLLVTAVAIAIGLLGRPFQTRTPRLDGENGQIQRHSRAHMALHWWNAIGFLLALYTGAVLLKWLPWEHDKVLMYVLHYVGASLILLGFVAVMVHALTRGGTSDHRLWPRSYHWRETGIELLSYAGLVGDHGILGFPWLQWPAAWRRATEKSVGYQGRLGAGKYLGTEKVLSYPLWAIVGGVLIVTGLLKGIRYAYPLSPALLAWSTTIHDIAAIATVVMLIIHVGAVVVVRTNWPLLRSMFTTRVDAAYVRQRHGAWYRELVQEAEQEAPAATGTEGAARARPTKA